jgi:hypothetical protein
MSGREIAHRCRGKVRASIDRVRTLARWNESFLKLPARFLTREYLEGEPARRFFFNGADETLAQLIETQFPEWIDRAIQEAGHILQGRVRLLGHGEIALGPVINWSANPVSGETCPRRYWADYDLVTNPEPGDPKVTYEMNRHQHLVTLGRAYTFTGDERYARAVVTQIDQWISQNPPGVGVNWHSSLEIAFRALSWMWALFLVLPSSSLQGRDIERLLRSLFSHFAHIHRYPSTYSSPNTHLSGEALALYVGGLVFHSLKQARAWRAFGRDVLLDELEKQVLDDGFHAELSTHYHCYALEFYLIALALARKLGDDFPAPMLSRIERMLDAVARLAGPDGSIPRLSDDDGGSALAMGAYGYSDVRSLLSTGAVLFDRPDFKWSAARIHEETLWLLGPGAYGAFTRLKERPPRSPNHLFRQSGYFVSRSGWDAGADRLVFDCGPLGFLGGGHGHADALSVTLSSGEKDLLVDSGTAVYNGAPHWRNYFRSTRAHNTVVVDGQDQADPRGTFGWKNTFSCRVTQHFTFAGADYVEAEHDAYGRLSHPVIHRRRVLHVRPRCWIIVDDFRGDGLHTFESFYHFAPYAAVSLDSRKSLTAFQVQAAEGGKGVCLAFFAATAVHPSIVHGSKDPVQGWHSRTYGDLKAAPVLCAQTRDMAPTASITAIVPRSLDAAAPTPTLREELIENGRGAGCAMENDGVEDLFVKSLEPYPIHVSNFTFHGDFLWARSRNGRVIAAVGINAAYASSGSSVLFDHPSPVSCVNVTLAEGQSTTVCADAERSSHVRN